MTQPAAKKTLTAERLPWPLVATALVAFAALYLTADQFIGIPLLELLLIVSQLTDLRLPDSRAISLAIRATIYALVIALMGYPEAPFNGWYLNPQYTNPLGVIVAAEVGIRAFELQNPARRLELLGTELFLICLTLIAASDVFEEGRHIQLLSPVFLVLLVLSIRALGRPAGARPSLRIFRATMTVLAVVLGFVMIQAALRVDSQVQMLFADWMHSAPRQSDIGLSISPSLGPTFNPEPSMERVLVIDGPRAERHLRVVAFDTYENSQWFPTLRDNRNFVDLTDANRTSTSAGQTLHFRLLGDTFNCLPLPLNASGLSPSNPVQRDQLGTIRFVEVSADPRYEVTVPRFDDFQGLACIPPDAAARQRALNVPQSVDPKVSDLARSVAGEGSPMVKVIRIAQHLQATHEYSLSFQPPRKVDPLSDFILNNRAAHCEYFASALAIMSRAAGVPSRLVTGFYAHEPAGENQTVVRDRDAHAWTECWIDGTGWITVDATPAGGLPDVRFPPASRWRRAWEMVVDLPSVLRDWLAQISRPAMMSIVFCCIAIALAFGIMQMLRNRRRAGGDLPYALPDAQLLELSRRFERWMRRRGIELAASRTWREQTAALTSADACSRFIETYERARFGGADPQAIAQLQRIFEELSRR